MGHNATMVRTHVITGYPLHVGAALHRAASDGRLAGVRHPVELPGRRVQVTADLREPVASAAGFPAASTWRWLRPLLVGLLVVAVAAGAIWGMGLLVQALIAAIAALGAWVVAQLPLIIAMGVGLLVLAVPAGVRCVGVHCGGCRR